MDSILSESVSESDSDKILSIKSIFLNVSLQFRNEIRQMPNFQLRALLHVIRSRGDKLNDVT